MNPIEALAPIIAGMHQDTDYIQVGTARCLNVGGTGLDVVVLEHTAHKNNSISYITSLVHCLLKFSPYTVQVEIDGVRKTYHCVMAGVCNGSQFGGGIQLCPVANNRDGLLDVIIMCKPKNLPTLAIMPGFVKGKHMGKPYTTHITCTSVKIETPAPIQLDGEIYRGLDFTARIIPGGCKTFSQQMI
jgi:diacylglycerol kinase (ATP)